MTKKLKIIRVTTKPVALNILLKGQLKFINKFHNVIAISSFGKEFNNLKNQEGVKTISLDMTRNISPIKDLISLIRMIKILKKECPDVVHSHTPKAGFISMLASAYCKIPHRLHTVGGLPLMEAKGLKKKILIFTEWLTYKYATKIYPNSYGLKKYILKNISVPKDKILVIGYGSSNGIDTNYFTRSEKVKRDANLYIKKYSLENMFNFIFVGRIVKDKGISELSSSFIKLNKKYKNTRLLLVGWEENDLDPIPKETKEMIKLNKNILNLGFKKDIRPFLAASNCLVLPSYREGFPNVVLQAGSMEVPAIVTNINGCNEIIKNEVNGLIIEPKNQKSLYLAMERIFLNSKLCNNLAKSSRKKIVEKFHNENFYNEVLSHYSNLNKEIVNGS